MNQDEWMDLQAVYKVELTGLHDWMGRMRAVGEFLESLLKGPLRGASEGGGDR